MGTFASMMGFTLEYSEGLFLHRESIVGRSIAGLAFGVLVLLPISRWLSRPWWLNLGVVVFATLGYGLENWSFEAVRTIIGETMWIYTGMWALMALSVTVPMLGRHRKTIIIPVMGCVAAYLAGMTHWAVMVLEGNGRLDFLPWPASAPLYYLPDVALFVMLSVAVSLRLWPSTETNEARKSSE